jgi:hypothetical protein
VPQEGQAQTLEEVLVAMYVGMVDYRVKPGQLEEAVRFWREQVEGGLGAQAQVRRLTLRGTAEGRARGCLPQRTSELVTTSASRTGRSQSETCAGCIVSRTTLVRSSLKASRSVSSLSYAEKASRVLAASFFLR